jgi:hypothetical protein
LHLSGDSAWGSKPISTVNVPPVIIGVQDYQRKTLSTVRALSHDGDTSKIHSFANRGFSGPLVGQLVAGPRPPNYLEAFRHPLPVSTSTHQVGAASGASAKLVLSVTNAARF